MITSIKIANFKIAQLKQELAAAQATIAEMREALTLANNSPAGDFTDTRIIEALAQPTNQDALHEALAREAEECAKLADQFDEGVGMAIRGREAAHRARKEGE